MGSKSFNSYRCYIFSPHCIPQCVEFYSCISISFARFSSVPFTGDIWFPTCSTWPWTFVSDSVPVGFTARYHGPFFPVSRLSESISRFQAWQFLLSCPLLSFLLFLFYFVVVLPSLSVFVAKMAVSSSLSPIARCSYYFLAWWLRLVCEQYFVLFFVFSISVLSK